ncbi:murein hydrolase activator EnvC family protein [Micromonospora sp. CA-111912]|uniref:murein hydrolase activator EnvC family protein n=1 Tax=Micromonospora sp. CA-111912 TaxID=3239955 RepID=UPI003D941C50
MSVAALCAAVLAAGAGPVAPPQSGAASVVIVSAVGPGPVPPGVGPGPVPPGPPGVGPALVPPGPSGVGPAAAPDAAARAQASTPDARFRWPLDGVPRPARRFAPPPQPWLPGHRGVDLIAVPGAVVRAAGSGVVLFAGPVAGRPVVTVGHDAGLRTTYEPVRPGVRAGDRVAAGAPLGRLLPGHPGCPEPACLHWGLRRGAEYLDPLALLGLGPVRLLPT